MECASSILDLAMRLWDSCANHAALVLDLDQKLNSLRAAMEELKELRDDVKRRIELAEQQQVKQQVEGWLKRVEVLDQQVNQILQSGQIQVQSKCFVGPCPNNCYATHKVAQRTVKMVGKVKEEISKGCFDGVADELPCALVNEKPIEKVVGLECALDEAWGMLENPEVGIIGLYGMGGVGKTTLLTKINNEFLVRRHKFELVIWIVVSRQAKVEEVQEAICNRVDIADTRWHSKGESDKADTIYKYLKKKRVLLLLDDVWEHLDLLKVGIPLSQGGKCKVVFTTRSQEVCSQMEAHRRIKVTCLAKHQAMTLFNQKVGEETLTAHPEIPSLAEIVAEECDGLPLALITIGRAMSGKKDPREWRRATEVLKSYPSRISGMGDHVFPILKFSYDSLRDDTLKNCFLYCSIFPEDYNILETNLVGLWIGEGFIDESYDIHEARDLGFDIIESLKLACLLETGNSANTVKMHDVIRDMALWLACTNGTKRHQILVQERSGLVNSLTFAKWNLAERISLWGATSVSGSPSCINLITLFVRDCKLNRLPSQFFHCMASIRVLDLSNSALTELPVGIKMLANLWYLNLSSTKLEKLPSDLGGLTEIRQLLLDFMKELTVIPHELIPKFSHMRVLSMIRCDSADTHLDKVVKGNVLSGGKELLLEELEQLEYLSDLCIMISRAHCVQKLLSSEKFRRCIRWLCLDRCQGLTEITLPSSSAQQIKNLEKLELQYCRQLKQIKISMGEQGSHWPGAHSSYGSNHSRNECFASLSSVSITDCPLVEMTWLTYLPCLEILHVQGCKLLEEVISDNPVIHSTEEVQGIFRRLKRIELFNLPSLKCLCPRPLPFPSLEEMKVMLCPNLRKLPFDSNTKTDVLLRIEGWPNWWENLQWEDESIKLNLQAFFSAPN